MVVCLRGCIWFSWIFLFPAPGEAAIALLPLRNGGSPSEGALPPPADKEQTCPTPSSLFYRDSERAARRTKPGVWTGDSAPSLLPFTESPGRGGGIPEAFVQAANALQKAALECSFEVSLPSGPCDSLCAHGGGRVLPALRLHSGVGERLPGTQFLARSLYRPVNTSGDTGWNPMRATPLDEEARLPPPRTEQG